jgi:TetR/AcrR family transcriptional repressor of multidrug resistance operon
MNVHSLFDEAVMCKRENILKAAEQLLAERGFYGLSMKVLAQKAGIAAGTIYRYFENKDMLMIELHHHISTEASQTILCGWSDEQTAEHKYALLWRNAFNAVLDNPRRLTVMEMLYCMPNVNTENSNSFEVTAFDPLVDFYQKGINEQRFHDWPVAALMSLSFDSAINLAKKVLRERLQVDEEILMQVRNASWQVIQKTS